ncbi:MAG: hypothetical protein CL843_16305 [Crocinitomicaceae bacterium]|nr:hypothetical protein [Crocinitomicaceae bacterium]|tara:strand:- start:7 stop:249 length:243 start_codon:yes stop_codon:yes gene_type:complete
MSKIRIEFEDQGQDFLTWLVEYEDGDVWSKVVECEPFQQSIWEGTMVFDVNNIQVGDRVSIQSKDGDHYTIKYLIENIED